MKINAGFFDNGDPHRRRQLRIDRPLQRRHVVRINNPGAGHLRQGVDAGIGTPRAMDVNLGPESADSRRPCTDTPLAWRCQPTRSVPS